MRPARVGKRRVIFFSVDGTPRYNRPPDPSKPTKPAEDRLLDLMFWAIEGLCLVILAAEAVNIYQLAGH